MGKGGKRGERGHGKGRGRSDSRRRKGGNVNRKTGIRKEEEKGKEQGNGRNGREWVGGMKDCLILISNSLHLWTQNV